MYQPLLSSLTKGGHSRYLPLNVKKSVSFYQTLQSEYLSTTKRTSHFKGQALLKTKEHEKV